MRLIDAYTLQDEIQKSKMKNPHKDAKVAKNHEFEHEHFMRMVVLQPTVQEEIVRCKDCKHGYECLPPCEDRYCIFYDQRHNEDWFCADGKRKDDDA